MMIKRIIISGIILLIVLPLFAKTITPNQYGLKEASTGIERYNVLLHTHRAALSMGCGVSYKGIARIEIEMPEEIRDIVTFPYKSCYIPKQDGKILLSYRDKKSRNRMIILNNKLLKND